MDITNVHCFMEINMLFYISYQSIFRMRYVYRYDTLCAIILILSGEQESLL